MGVVPRNHLAKTKQYWPQIHMRFPCRKTHGPNHFQRPRKVLAGVAFDRRDILSKLGCDFSRGRAFVNHFDQRLYLALCPLLRFVVLHAPRSGFALERSVRSQNQMLVQWISVRVCKGGKAGAEFFSRGWLHISLGVLTRLHLTMRGRSRLNLPLRLRICGAPASLNRSQLRRLPLPQPCN